MIGLTGNRVEGIDKLRQNIHAKFDELENYHSHQRALDSEIEGQLNIMYKISMQLQTKKQQISCMFEKYSPDHSRLHSALESLKEK